MEGAWLACERASEVLVMRVERWRAIFQFLGIVAVVEENRLSLLAYFSSPKFSSFLLLDKITSSRKPKRLKRLCFSLYLLLFPESEGRIRLNIPPSVLQKSKRIYSREP